RKISPDVSGRAGPSRAPALGSRRRRSRPQVSLAQRETICRACQKIRTGSANSGASPGGERCNPTAKTHGRLGDRCASALQLALAPTAHAPPGSGDRTLLELEPLAGGCLETRRETLSLELCRSGVDPDRSRAANSLRQGAWRRRRLHAPLRKG